MELTVQKINDVFVAETLQAADVLGDKYKPSVPCLEFVMFDNTESDAPKTITIDSPVNCNQGHSHDLTLIVAAGQRGYKAHLPRERFADSDGYINISYNDVTDLKVGVFKII